MIDGVKVKKLRTIPDERGRLTELLRNDGERVQGPALVLFVDLLRRATAADLLSYYED